MFPRSNEIIFSFFLLSLLLSGASSISFMQSNQSNNQKISIGSNHSKNLVVKLTISQSYPKNNLILGWDMELFSLKQMMASQGNYDTDSYFASNNIQTLYISYDKFTNFNLINTFIVRTDLTDGIPFYSYDLIYYFTSSIECGCSIISNCSCLSHGVIECTGIYIGKQCDIKATPLSITAQISVLLSTTLYFRFKVLSENTYNLKVDSVDNYYNLEMKFYTSNSTVLPYPETSEIDLRHSKEDILTIIPLSSKSEFSSDINFNVILLKLSTDSSSPFTVNLQLNNLTNDYDSGSVLKYVIITVGTSIVVFLLLAIIYLIRARKAEQILFEQRRMQQINQGTIKLTMGEEDMKQYMPSVFYKEVKGKLMKICQLQDKGTCIVCLCEFEDQEEIRSTYCKHIFHSKCLTDWMKKNESCPYCRTALTKENMIETFNKEKKNSLNWLDAVPPPEHPHNQDNKNSLIVHTSMKNTINQQDQKTNREKNMDSEEKANDSLNIPQMSARIKKTESSFADSRIINHGSQANDSFIEHSTRRKFDIPEQTPQVQEIIKGRSNTLTQQEDEQTRIENQNTYFMTNASISKRNKKKSRLTISNMNSLSKFSQGSLFSMETEEFKHDTQDDFGFKLNIQEKEEQNLFTNQQKNNFKSSDNAQFLIASIKKRKHNKPFNNRQVLNFPSSIIPEENNNENPQFMSKSQVQTSQDLKDFQLNHISQTERIQKK